MQRQRTFPIIKHRETPMPTPNSLDTAAINKRSYALRPDPHLAFSVLIGSRATGEAHHGNDRDIAVQWSPKTEGLNVLADTESLQHKLAQSIGTSDSAIASVAPISPCAPAWLNSDGHCRATIRPTRRNPSDVRESSEKVSCGIRTLRPDLNQGGTASIGRAQTASWA